MKLTGNTHDEVMVFVERTLKDWMRSLDIDPDRYRVTYHDLFGNVGSATGAFFFMPDGKTVDRITAGYQKVAARRKPDLVTPEAIAAYIDHLEAWCAASNHELERTVPLRVDGRMQNPTVNECREAFQAESAFVVFEKLLKELGLPVPQVAQPRPGRAA